MMPSHPSHTFPATARPENAYRFNREALAPHGTRRALVMPLMRLGNRHWAAWALLCAGLLATAFTTLYVREEIEQDAVSRFSVACDRIVTKISERLSAHTLALQGAAALFARNGAVDRQEWRGYFDTLALSQNIRGAQAIAFAPAVRPEQLPALIARARADGLREFDVRPHGPRGLYGPVLYAEPMNAINTKAMGYDMLSDPTRRAAMERARDTGMATLSGRVSRQVSPNRPGEAGALLYVPVFRAGEPWNTVAQRRAALIGWAYSPYRMDALFAGITDSLRDHIGHEINFKIYDGMTATPDTLMFYRDPARELDPGSVFYHEKLLNFNDRTWLLAFDIPPDMTALNYFAAWLTLAAGLALSGLLWALMRSITNTRSRAAEIAGMLTAELRLKEKLLQESEYRWKFAVEGAGDGLFDRKIPGDTVFRSRRWREMLGYSDADIGEDRNEWLELIHPDDRNDVVRATQDLIDGAVSTYVHEHRLRCKDGSYKWILARGAIVRRAEDGQPLRLIGTHSDISARKRAEEAAQLARISVEAASDAHFWLAADGRVVDVNGAACHMYGYTREEMLKLHAWDFNESDYASKPNWPARFVEIGKMGTLTHQTTHLTKSGSRIPVEIVITRVSFGGEEFNCAFVRDISDRKLNEAALRAAISEAENANQAKSRFLAAASHDLRQPLSALSLYVGVLKSRATPQGDGIEVNIQDCVNSLSALLTDLLDVSKLDAGVVVPRATDVALDDLFATLVSVHAVDAELRGLRLRKRRSGVTVHADRQLLYRILGNLLSNAIRYTNKGGVLIAHRRHNGRGWVEVWDTGIGIEEAHTGIIFEEFRQLKDDARNRGSGLGLAIVAKTAELLGLQVRVRSRPGRGSMFAIELPDTRVAGFHEPAGKSTPTDSLKIGLVEDNAGVRQALTLALETLGHLVLPARTGKELLLGLEQQAPDIIISDYRLPRGETGFQVIEAARAAFGPDLPAILITGDTDPALIRSMADRGIAVHYKPLQIDELQVSIFEAVANRV
jgi:PAS domain S-box-containing protein